jgi:uncharacterized protein
MEAVNVTHPVVHWEIGGRDPDRLQRFYGDLFGWKVDQFNSDYGLVETGDGMGGAIMRSPSGTPPHVTIYVQVDELRSTLDRVHDLGGAALVDPTPIANVGSFALFRDPEGNIVGLLKPAQLPA